MARTIPVQAAPLYGSYLQEREDPAVLYRLALAYDQLGQPEKSLQYLQGRNNVEDDFELNMLQGQICYRLHRFEEARLSFVKAAGCDKCKNGKAWLLAGYASLQMNDFSQGRKAFVQAAQYREEKKIAIKALAQLDEAAMARLNSNEQSR